MTNHEIDTCVLAAITDRPGLTLKKIVEHVCADHLLVTDRQVDRSLQRLRKAKSIEFGGPGTTFTGWRRASPSKRDAMTKSKSQGIYRCKP